MCGITGYIGWREAANLLLKSLNRLEYRGYDSAGMATMGSAVQVAKGTGTVEEVNSQVDFASLQGSLGIAHTRWATHGDVTEVNAHPHLDCEGKIAVIHNGVIENYQELKRDLKEDGHSFSSETDTEVIAHLIERFIDEGKGTLEAVFSTIEMLQGSFAVLVMRENDERIYAARHKSPLVIGRGENENFIASDTPAFLEHTKRAIFLEDGEVAVLERDSVEVYDPTSREPIEREEVVLEWDLEESKKGGYDHFMIKEIMEQRDSIEEAITQEQESIKKAAEMINDAFGAFLVGCGTSYHACLASSYLFSKIAGKHVNVALASEFPHFEEFLTEDTLMVAVSQSGETADVLEAVRYAKEKGVKVLAVVNVMGSTLMRMADYTLLLHAGPEICVLATKSYTSQLALLGLLAYAVADRYEEGKREIGDVIEKVRYLLETARVQELEELADEVKDSQDAFVIGRGLSYPTALEGALKLKEVSYIHAEGMAGGELKHGTLALIEDGTPCIAVVPEDETKEDTLSNIAEIEARGGKIIGLSSEDNELYDHYFHVPNETARYLHPIVMAIPLQLLSYFVAVKRGCNVDKPRNLAKSVTVK